MLAFTFAHDHHRLVVFSFVNSLIESPHRPKNEAVENIENNMAMAMMRKVNESILKMLNRQDNGEDGQTKKTHK